MKNFYHILGLSFESKPEKSLIEAAYKALVKLYHPDIYNGTNKELKRKITEINEAYDTLSNLAKKEVYDKKLLNFHLEKSYDFSESKFEEKEEFSKDFLNDDWEVASIVYPELEEICKKLFFYDKKLALQYQFYLLETKKFHKKDEIMNDFINAFLEKKFGSSKIIKKLSRFLIENKNKKQATYLNKLVKVVGSKSDKKIMNAFFKEYPDIEHQYFSESNFIKKQKITFNEDDRLQKLTLFISFFFLILFLVYLN